MYYTFSCDLIGKYSTKVIAECIGAPVVMIRALISIHTLGALIRRKDRAKPWLKLRTTVLDLTEKLKQKVNCICCLKSSDYGLRSWKPSKST